MTSLWSVTYRLMPGTSPKRRGPTTPCRAAWGQSRVGQGTERNEGKRGQSPSCVFCGKQLGADGGSILARVGLSLGLAPGPGLVQGREGSWLGVWKSDKEGGEGVCTQDWLVCICQVCSR